MYRANSGPTASVHRPVVERSWQKWAPQREAGHRLLGASEWQSLGSSEPPWGWRRPSLNYVGMGGAQPALGWVQVPLPRHGERESQRSHELRERFPKTQRLGFPPPRQPRPARRPPAPGPMPGTQCRCEAGRTCRARLFTFSDFKKVKHQSRTSLKTNSLTGYKVRRSRVCHPPIDSAVSTALGPSLPERPNPCGRQRPVPSESRPQAPVRGFLSGTISVLPIPGWPAWGASPGLDVGDGIPGTSGQHVRVSRKLAAGLDPGV